MTTQLLQRLHGVQYTIMILRTSLVLPVANTPNTVPLISTLPTVQANLPAAPDVQHTIMILRTSLVLPVANTPDTVPRRSTLPPDAAPAADIPPVDAHY